MNRDERNPGDSYPVEYRKSFGLGNEIQAGYDHWSSRADYSVHYPGDSTKSLSDYVDMFYKRKKLFLTVFFFVVSLTAVVLFFTTKVYRCSATLEIEKPVVNAQEATDASFMMLNFNKMFASQVKLLKSRSVVEELVAKMRLGGHLQKEREKRSWPASFLSVIRGRLQGLLQSRPDGDNAVTSAEQSADVDAVDWILARLDVEPFPTTQLAQVSMEASNPGMAKRILEGYLEVYLERNVQKMRLASKQQNDWLKHEMDKVEKQLLKSQAALVEFTNKHGIVSLDGEANQFITSFNKSADALVKAGEARAKLESYSNQPGNIGLPEILASKHLQRLQEELAQVEKEYYEFSGIYFPEHPKMRMLRARMDSMKERIKETEKDAMNSALEVSRKEGGLLKKAFDRAKKEAMEINSLKIQYAIVKKEVDTNEQLYNNLLKRSRDLDVNMGTLVNNITIREPPVMPRWPVSPNKPMWLFIGAFLGSLVGGLAVLYAEARDTTLSGPQDVERRLGLQYLGSVPTMKTLKGYQPFAYEYSGREMSSPRYKKATLIQALSNISSSMSSLASPEGAAIVAVSSALPSEGKTVLSTLIAIATSSEGNKVLVVDADLRNPKMHKVFGTNGDFPGKGLRDLLAEDSMSVEELICDTSYPGLSYIPAGIITSNPLPLLKSERLKSTLDQCREMFDFVIIDSPPIIGLSDSRVLSGVVDGIILVAKEGHAPIVTIRQAAKMVSISNAKILGLVISMTATGAMGHY